MIAKTADASSSSVTFRISSGMNALGSATYNIQKLGYPVTAKQRFDNEGNASVEIHKYRHGRAIRFLGWLLRQEESQTDSISILRVDPSLKLTQVVASPKNEASASELRAKLEHRGIFINTLKLY